MDEEVNSRQRELEREIACLKDTIWRLTSRVCVLESFLKNKYGNIADPTGALAISRTSTPMKVIPIVIPEPDTVVQHMNETEIIVKGMEAEPVAETMVETEVETTTDSVPEMITEVESETTTFTDTFVEDCQVEHVSVTTTEVSTDDLSLEEQVIAGSLSPAEGEAIRIYRPELKTFVTVKLDTPLRDSPDQLSTGDWQCHICRKTFSQDENVQRHMINHRSSQFKCDECGREFNHQGNLNTHKLRHERMNKRKLEMEERLKTVQTKAQTDIENRKFPCSYCDKRFYTAQQRNIHTRIHTGEKPFECNICGMRFNQKATLQDHVLGHTGEKTNCCHLCPASFVRSRNLLKHIRQVHKMVQIKTILNGERVVEFVAETEAAAIIDARKGNIEVKRRPTKSRVRRTKQQHNGDLKRKMGDSEKDQVTMKQLKIELSDELCVVTQQAEESIS